MKFFAFILSVYILSLSCFPCSDKDECKFEMQTNASPIAATDHSDHEKGTESCSPFCGCSCCGQTCNYEIYTYSPPFHPPLIAQVFSIYTTSLFSEVQLAIWQPPKIN